jgi:hypothetical protein
MQEKQASILDGAARLLKGGGRLVYATCSLLNEENDFIVEQFLANHPDFVLVPMNKVLAEQKIELDMGDYLKLLPHKHQTDGFFAAVLERKPMPPKPPKAPRPTTTPTPPTSNTPPPMPLSNLLTDLLSDLRDPGMLWQAGRSRSRSPWAGGGARLIRAASLRAQGRRRAIRWRMGVLNFAHVLSPLLIVALLALAKLVLAKFHQQCHGAAVALPLFGSLAVIRAAFYMLRRVFARHGPVGAAHPHLRKNLRAAGVAGGGLYIAGLWPLIFDFLDDTYCRSAATRPR